jgi:hypothetical protein
MVTATRGRPQRAQTEASPELSFEPAAGPDSGEGGIPWSGQARTRSVGAAIRAMPHRGHWPAVDIETEGHMGQLQTSAAPCGAAEPPAAGLKLARRSQEPEDRTVARTARIERKPGTARMGSGHPTLRPGSAPRLFLALLSPALVLLLSGDLGGHTPITTRFTYLRDVRPLFERRCGSCHHPDGIAPMSLLSYREARPWAAAIRAAVLRAEMPPWPAEAGLGFEGERSLTGREIDLLADWASGGAPEGEEPTLPAPSGRGEPRPESTGAPDLVLSMSEPRVLAAGVNEERFQVALPTGLERERWISGWELRAGNPAILHGAVIEMEGIESDGIVTEAKRPPELLGSWTPGQAGVSYPPETGRRLSPGTNILLSLHHQRGFQHRGREMADRCQIALWFLAEPPRFEVHQRLVPVRGTLELPGGGTLLALMPIAKPSALAAGSLQVEARPPAGPPILLLEAPRIAAAWPIALRTSTGLSLLPGTRVERRGPPEARREGELDLWIETAEPRSP